MARYLRTSLLPQRFLLVLLLTLLQAPNCWARSTQVVHGSNESHLLDRITIQKARADPIISNLTLEPQSTMIRATWSVLNPLSSGNIRVNYLTTDGEEVGGCTIYSSTASSTDECVANPLPALTPCTQYNVTVYAASHDGAAPSGQPASDQDCTLCSGNKECTVSSKTTTTTASTTTTTSTSTTTTTSTTTPSTPTTTTTSSPTTTTTSPPTTTTTSTSTITTTSPTTATTTSPPTTTTTSTSTTTSAKTTIKPTVPPMTTTSNTSPSTTASTTDTPSSTSDTPTTTRPGQTTPTSTTTTLPEDDDTLPAATIAVIVIGCLLLLLLVAFVAVGYVKRDYIREKFSREGSQSGRSSNPSTADLLKNVEEKLTLWRSKPDALKKEFSNIQKKSYEGNTDIASLHENSKKNRYHDILPFDDHLVQLHRPAIPPDTNYINASFVPSSDPARVWFIATQGPTSNTLTDFWWTIWEQGVPIIVMLTKCVEGAKDKCKQYWPESQQSLKVAPFTVVLQQEITKSQYTERRLMLHKDGDAKKRTVTQFHFTRWPDFGVPASEEELLSFLRVVRRSLKPVFSSIVVHCSAGVGRTGTFIGLWNLQQQYEQHQPLISINNTILEMRLCRASLVQTENQYRYLTRCFRKFLQQKIDLKKQTSSTGKIDGDQREQEDLQAQTGRRKTPQTEHAQLSRTQSVQNERDTKQVSKFTIPLPKRSHQQQKTRTPTQ